MPGLANAEKSAPAGRRGGRSNLQRGNPKNDTGPVPEGSMVLVLKRHTPHLDELNEEEAAEMGRLQATLSGAIRKVTGAYVVYGSLWTEGSPHVHFVFMPVTEELRQKFGGLKASKLQAAMNEADYSPDPVRAREFSVQIAEVLREGWPTSI